MCKIFLLRSIQKYLKTLTECCWHIPSKAYILKTWIHGTSQQEWKVVSLTHRVMTVCPTTPSPFNMVNWSNDQNQELNLVSKTFLVLLSNTKFETLFCVQRAIALLRMIQCMCTTPFSSEQPEVCQNTPSHWRDDRSRERRPVVLKNDSVCVGPFAGQFHLWRR